MKSADQACTRAAAACLATLGALHLLHVDGLSGAVGYRDVIGIAFGALALLAAAKIWCATCVESHLIGTLVAAGTLSGQLLAALVGLPDGGDVAWSAGRILLLAVSVVTVLLSVQHLAHATTATEERPYAR